MRSCCTIQIEREQIPKIFDATEVIGLDVSLLVACGFGFLVFEAHLELFEDGVAQLFEKMNVSRRSSRTPKRNR